MAFVNKSQRNFSFDIKSTSNLLGPGSYLDLQEKTPKRSVYPFNVSNRLRFEYKYEKK